MAIAKSITAELVSDTGTSVYKIPTGYCMTGNIRVTNRNNTPVSVKVALCKGASPLNQEYIDFDVTIPANGVMEDTSLIIPSEETIYVWSNSSNVCVRVHGIEEIM